MSQGTWNIDNGPFQGFYRDRENGWIFGVCAGLADRFNLRISAVRVIAVISLLVFFWLTAAIYVAATLLIREKPLIYSGQRTENDIWRRYRRDHWRQQRVLTRQCRTGAFIVMPIRRCSVVFVPASQIISDSIYA
jgi:phage shock protein C